ncbi:MAG: hypothetical protein Q7J07_04050 [Pelolinea sp.]|nr:hypothetical protein [Pelolinea sp.]
MEFCTAKRATTPAKDVFLPDFPLISLEVDNLDKTVESLMRKVIEFDSSVEEQRDSRWIRVCDPSGNLIQLVEIKK